MTGQAKDESVIELGDSVPAPLGFNAFGPECLFYAGKHWSGGQGSAGMRPERRLQRRNGGAAHSPPQNETQKTPPDISLLRAKNGLDNGVHLTLHSSIRVANGMFQRRSNDPAPEMAHTFGCSSPLLSPRLSHGGWARRC
jgi:hypothetical protein